MTNITAAEREKIIQEYKYYAGEEVVDNLLSLSESLEGVSIQQINSARVGGGVAEMLQSLIPLENILGVDVRWDVISGTPEFFNYTKTMHNFLQGKEAMPDIMGIKEFWEINRQNKDLVDEDADIMLIHDPQPAGLIALVDQEKHKKKKWIWRCHIQLAEAHCQCIDFLKPLIEYYDISIFSSSRFLGSWNITPFIILPYIDPLSDKNRELTNIEIQEVLDRFEIGDLEEKPLITLVSRFDPFKGHEYAVQAFEMVRKEMPCQLVMVGGTASDDPENQLIFEQLQEKVGEHPDIHMMNLPPDSGKEINAIQRASSIILQPSLKEGFGLTVTEGMWKGKPVIGGDTGGIPSQIADGYNGFLIAPGSQGVEDMARRIAYLLRHPLTAREMGRRGQATVRERFLITRGIWDELILFKELMEGGL